MTKQKLIALIIKKQTYKELKPIISQISKQNIDTIKTSIQAIQQILTKQYNAESKLYALRVMLQCYVQFLKDSFEMGSKPFIKQTDQILLPLIVNIVIESTDETAITKYAGSSFTKSTDLAKFKSIIVSFFRLSKQLLSKWALWIPNAEFKFKDAFTKLQKKGIKFQAEYKYYRPQNQTNFFNNCKQNGFPIQTNIERKSSGISNNSNNQLKLQQKQQSKSSINSKKQITIKDKQVLSHKENSKLSQQQQQKSSTISQQSIPQLSLLGKRYPPKGNNKYILKCHQIFKQYDEKLKKGTIKDEDIQMMKSQINSQLEEYMGTPDLNQTQMESELTQIFENIKNVTDDYAKFKQRLAQNNLSMQTSLSKMKNTIKKTQQLSTKKIERPLSPINKLQTPMKQSPKDQLNQVKNQVKTNQSQNIQSKMKKPEVQVIPKKEEVVPVKLSTKKQEIQKVQVFDDSSMFQSQIKPSQKTNERPGPKKQEGVSRSSKKVQNLSNFSKKINEALKEEQKSSQVQKSSMKGSKKGGTREYFDSQLSVSRSESSRVIFSESSNDEDSNDEDSRIPANFKKQKTKLKLSSIAEEEMEKYGESSRRNNNESHKQSNLKHDIQSFHEEQRKIVVEKSSLLPSEVKVSKSAIDQYESKIKNLQQNLQQKQQKERQLSMKLNELNQMKLQQERQLDKIKVQNSKIMQRFSNAVDGQEYGKIKRDFDEMKGRNRMMEGQMERLLKQIQVLKVAQKAQIAQQSHIIIQSSKQNDVNYNKSKQPNKIMESSQNLLKQSLNKKSSLPQPQKPKYTFHQIDPNEKRVYFTKLHQTLDENNLNLLKKNLIGGDELFYTSQQVAFACRTSPFKNQRLTLQLELSFQFKGGRRNPIRPNITISNIEEAEVWKKQIVGDEDLFHLDIVVKLKKFPFNLMKLYLSWGDDMKKSVYLPLVYWNFLRKCEFNQLEFERMFENNAQSVIKSKIFNLNSKIVKDLKSLAIYQGYKLPNQNRMCFKLYQESQRQKVFWCQVTNLSRQKCILKIVPQPFNQEMVNKADQLMKNILFLVG